MARGADAAIRRGLAGSPRFRPEPQPKTQYGIWVGQSSIAPISNLTGEDCSLRGHAEWLRE
jgi:hypothetical protein